MSEKVCYYCEGSGYLMRTPKKSRKSLIKCFVCDEPAIEGITLEEFGESLKLVDAFYKGKIEDAKQHYVKWDREKMKKFWMNLPFKRTVIGAGRSVPDGTVIWFITDEEYTQTRKEIEKNG